MAPSPASVGDVQTGEDGVPTKALNKLALDDEVRSDSGANDGDDTVTGHPLSSGQALDVELDVTDGEVKEIIATEHSNDGVASASAPVMLGAVL